MKKYELTDEVKEVLGHKLHRIRALKDFGDVHKGDLGGWVESEENLSQEGTGWVYGDAMVYDNAEVCGDARVYGDALVYGDARVCGDAEVCDNARVCGNARIFGDAMVYGDAWVYDHAMVCGDARVYGDAMVCGNAKVYGDARVCGDAFIRGDARVCGDAFVYGNEAILTITNIGSRAGTTTFFNLKDGKIGVKCGCFCGDIDEFAAAVNKTHGDNKFAVRYKLAIELARAAIETRKEET